MRTSSTFRTRGTVKRTTRAAAALAAGALALSLTACGGDDDNGSDDSGDKGGGTKQPATSVTLPKLDGESLEVAAVWTGTEQENFKKVLTEFEEAHRRQGDLRARPGPDHQLPRLEDRGRRPAGRGDAPAARRHQAGRGQGLGQAAGRRGDQGTRRELLAGLAGHRQGRRQAVRRVLQGRQQVADLVQHPGLRERGRRRAEDLGRAARHGPDGLRLRCHPVLRGRRGRLDAHRLVRERLPLAGGPGEVRTSSPSTRSSGRTRP
ncbi:hypothetical protein STENM36S_02388 [Streptomyces tendae]